MKPSLTLQALSQPNTSGNASPIGEGCTETRSPSKCEQKRGNVLKVKTCPVCRNEFTPRTPLQKVCSLLCAVSHVAAARAKRERKETREAKAKLKTRRDYEREAQVVFNKWVRLRDASQPCISCGRFHDGKYDAGHYRSVGSNPALRFEPTNVHKQCVPCNQHKSGNVIEYRIHLIARIGVEAVEWLEGPHEPKHYTIDDLKALKATYAAKCRELEAKQCCSI